MLCPWEQTCCNISRLGCPRSRFPLPVKKKILRCNHRSETVHPESAPHGHTAILLPNAKYVGTVYLLTVISDRGYVCDVQLIRGFEKTADAKAISAVRQWHFYPEQKAGRPFSGVRTFGIPIWRDADGQLYLGTYGNYVK